MSTATPAHVPDSDEKARKELEARIAERIYSEEGFRYHERIMFLRLMYALAGLLLGLACVLGGIVLFLHGVTGSTSWTAKIVGAESKLSDAAPGAVLFVIGLFVVVVTRFKNRSMTTSRPPFWSR